MGETAFAPLIGEGGVVVDRNAHPFTIDTAGVAGNSGLNIPIPVALPDVVGHAQEGLQRLKAESAATPQISKGYGALPHIIAIAAAAKGNFGPLFQISEQTRKTQLYGEVMPYITKARSLANAGKTTEAHKLLTELMGGVGERAPELSQFIQGTLGKLDQKEQLYIRLKQIVDLADDQLPEDDPRRSDLKFWKNVVSYKTGLSDELIKRAETSLLDRDVKVERGMSTVTGGTAGRSVVNSLPVVPVPSDVPVDVMGQVLKQFPGATPADIHNAVSGQPTPYTIPSGQYKGMVIDLSQQGNVGLLKQKLSEEAGVASNINQSSNVNFTPALTEQLVGAGVDPRLVAQRKGLTEPIPGSNDTRSAFEVAQAGEAAQRGAVTEQNVRARQRSDVTELLKAGQVAVNINSGDFDNFMQQPDKPMTVADAEKDKNIRIMDTKRYDEARSLWQGYKGLQLVNKVFDVLDDPNSIKDRISTGLTSLVSSYLGYTPESLSGTYVGRAIIERAISNLERSGRFSSTYMANLKTSLIGHFAGEKVGKQSAREAAAIIKDDLGTYIGRGRVPEFGTVSFDKGVDTGSDSSKSSDGNSGNLVEIKLPDGTSFMGTPTEKTAVDRAIATGNYQSTGTPTGPAQQKPTKRYIRRER